MKRMTPVQRYHAELDNLTAPDALKEKLYNIPAQYSAVDVDAEIGNTAHAASGEQPEISASAAATVNNEQPEIAANAAAAASNAQPEAIANAAASTATPRQSAIHFPRFGKLPTGWKKQALTAAACFLVGVFATDALGWQVVPNMSSMSTDSAGTVMTTTGTTNALTSGAMMEESIDGATLDSLDLTNGSITESAAESAAEPATMSSTDTTATADASETRTVTEADTTRKIIYTTDLTLETLTYDDTLATLEATVSAVGGYLSFGESYTLAYSSGERRSGYYSYRIPAAQYTAFMSGVGEAGNITCLTESADDVTTTYLDLEARITTLTQQRDRLWELQASAETLTDLLEIEATLTEVLYQIERYQSQLNYLADQVSYATVTIYLDEVIEYTVTEPTAWETISNAFASGTSNFVRTIAAVFLFILSVWVWVILAVVGILVYYSVKRNKHNKAK